MEKPPSQADSKSLPKLSRKLANGLPYYAAIGQAASTWAHLETEIDLAVLSFVPGKPIPMACALAQMFSIYAKLDTLIAVAQSDDDDRVSDETIAKLTKFGQSIRPLSIQRNRLIHDPLIQEGKDVRFLQLSTKGPRGRLVFKLVPFELKAISDFIRNTADRVDDFKAIKAAMDKDRAELKAKGKASSE